MVLRIERGRVARAVFPPQEVAQVKAIACELPREHDVPLSRFSRAELHRLVIERAVCEASASTIARWLSEDAIKPWQHRSWIFPRDPRFVAKAGPVLDLYERRWEGELLHPGDFVICADEKTQIQARRRDSPTTAPAPGRAQRVEHDYDRGGALCYLAAWDVHRGQLIGRCEQQTGIVPFARLVTQVMTAEPYNRARRVFWIVDNGSSHRGQKSVERLQQAWPNLVLVHLPFYASWLNQIEIVFSVIPAQGADPQRLLPACRPSIASTPSSTTTTRSPSRSSGRSPAATSPTSSRASPITSRDSGSPPDRHRTYGRDRLAKPAGS